MAEQRLHQLIRRLDRLVEKRLSNPEIASELFISRKAVEYRLSNV